MEEIEEFYRCFGCGKEYAAELDAQTCCAVAQHIWRCTKCGGEFATETKAVKHLQDVKHELIQFGGMVERRSLNELRVSLGHC